MNARIARTRQALADAAVANLAERGGKGLNLTALSKTSGISRATIHNHIRSDADLIQVIWDSEFAKVVALMQVDSAAKALEQLATFIAEHPAIIGMRTHDPVLLVQVHHFVISNPERISIPISELLLRLNLSSDLMTVETVIRWLTSWFWDSGDQSSRELGSEIVAAGLNLDARL
jgi:AcrR family transcriptional regulator